MSEPRASPTFINATIMVFELKAWTIRAIEVLAPLESNSEIDSTSYYRELVHPNTLCK